MLGTLTLLQIEEVIKGQIVGRIGCHANGMTYVVPVSYAYDGDYIYVRTFEGLKLDMMRKNPKVCFQVDDTHDMANWQSVIASGEFEELTNETEKKAALKILIDRHQSKIYGFIYSKIQSSKNISFIQILYIEFQNIIF